MLSWFLVRPWAAAAQREPLDSLSMLRREVSPVDSSLAAKSATLLRFLKDTATLRRKRIPAYGAGDKLVWFGEVPKDRPECRSAFHADNPAEFPDLWLLLSRNNRVV
jgi:hypothetical protein